MSRFFESEQVKESMEEIFQLQKELYDTIKDVGNLQALDMFEHIDKLKELLEKQQVMYTRMSLSDDEEAKTLQVKMLEQSKKMGFGDTDMNTIFMHMKQTLEKLQEGLHEWRLVLR